MGLINTEGLDRLDPDNRERGNDTDRLNWLLSLEGRNAFYWAVENGEKFEREDIDAKRGAS